MGRGIAGSDKGFWQEYQYAWVPVGAGLPAMLAPRCERHTGVMLSQASQLPRGRRQASELIVPTLCVGMLLGTLCVRF
ncbi:hypothetical protein EUX58_04300 [Pseudomonas sp. 770NI]|nr:hypothetical protein EUX58_04300 [Pseudomonas sp. 770NI]